MSDRVECAFCGVLVEKDEDGLWQHSIPSEITLLPLRAYLNKVECGNACRYERDVRAES